MNEDTIICSAVKEFQRKCYMSPMRNYFYNRAEWFLSYRAFTGITGSNKIHFYIKLYVIGKHFHNAIDLKIDFFLHIIQLVNCKCSIVFLGLPSCSFF